MPKIDPFTGVAAWIVHLLVPSVHKAESPLSISENSSNLERSVLRNVLRGCFRQLPWPLASEALVEEQGLEATLRTSIAAALKQNLGHLADGEGFDPGAGVTLTSTPTRHETSPHSVQTKCGCSSASCRPSLRHSNRQM